MNIRAIILSCFLLLFSRLAFAYDPYLIVTVDVQKPNDQFHIDRTFYGSPPFVAFDIQDNGTNLVNLSGWSSFMLVYSYDRNANEGKVVIPSDSIVSNRVYFKGLTNILFQPGDYFAQLVGIHDESYMKPFGEGTMTEVYSPGTDTNVLATMGQITLSWWTNNLALIVAAFETSKLDRTEFYGILLTNNIVTNWQANVISADDIANWNSAGTAVNTNALIAGIDANSNAVSAETSARIGADSALSNSIATNVTALIAVGTNKVSKTGDTMTGNLIAPNIDSGPLMTNSTAVAVGKSAIAAGGAGGTAIGESSRGAYSGTAVGKSANGWSGGVAVGDSSYANSYGAALGWDANGGNYGVAAGYQTRGTNNGVAIGRQSVGSQDGVAVGNQANGELDGVAISKLANASCYGIAIGRSAYAVGGTVGGSNIAIGHSANANPTTNGLYRITIGTGITNEYDNSTILQGTLYLDGSAASIYYRTNLRSGAWADLINDGPTNFVRKTGDTAASLRVTSGLITQTNIATIASDSAKFTNSTFSDLVGWKVSGSLGFDSDKLSMLDGLSGTVSPSNLVTLPVGAYFHVSYILPQASTGTVTWEGFGRTNTYSFAGSAASAFTNEFWYPATGDPRAPTVTIVSTKGALTFDNLRLGVPSGGDTITKNLWAENIYNSMLYGKVDSNFWDLSDSKTNYVRRTGDSMSGVLIAPNLDDGPILTNSSDVAVGKSADASSYGTAVGLSANGSGAGTAVGEYANGSAGVAVGQGAQGQAAGVAVGMSANGMTDAVAAGNTANGHNYGVAVGAYAIGYGHGVAVGYQASGTNYGSALGYMAKADQDGVAIGDQANGALDGIAISKLANAYCYGIALGRSANAFGGTVGGSNIAIGHSANANPSGSALYRIAFGTGTTNENDNSFLLRGTLYLDGGSNVYYRTNFGSGAWTALSSGGGSATNIGGFEVAGGNWNATTNDRLSLGPDLKWTNASPGTIEETDGNFFEWLTGVYTNERSAIQTNNVAVSNVAATALSQSQAPNLSAGTNAPAAWGAEPTGAVALASAVAASNSLQAQVNTLKASSNNSVYTSFSYPSVYTDLTGQFARVYGPFKPFAWTMTNHFGCVAGGTSTVEVLDRTISAGTWVTITVFNVDVAYTNCPLSYSVGANHAIDYYFQPGSTCTNIGLYSGGVR